MAVNIQLKDFDAKTSPVPADIVYLGNSADSFNEVKSTIAQVIAAYPALSSIAGLTTAANELIYTTGADTYAVAPLTAFGRSVLALSAATTAPAAGVLAGWDANKNISANNVIPGFTSTPSAAGTTTLTVGSTRYQEITGSTTQTIQMPVASTMVAGTPFTIINNSTGVGSAGAVTINSSGGNLIQVLAAGQQLDLVLLINSGTTATSWKKSYPVQLSPTVDQVISFGSLRTAAGQMLSGAVTGGFAGNFVAFSATASLGYLQILCADNAGNYGNILTNASTTAQRTWTLPDITGTVAVPIDSTFTTTVSCSSPGDLSVAYANQTGICTRIGGMIFVNYRIQFTPTFTTASGQVQFGGLPVPCQVGNGIGWAGAVGFFSGSSTWPVGKTSISVLVESGASFCSLTTLGSASASSSLQMSGLVSGVQYQLVFSVAYHV